MKTRKIRRKGVVKKRIRKVIAICLCCLMPVLAVTCATSPVVLEEGDPIFGTWVNEEYDQSARSSFYGRVVVFPDGHEFDYKHIIDTEPVWENWLTFEKVWIDEAGNHWYKINFVGWVYPSGAGKEEGFSLLRISADGRTSESVMAQYGYPDDITPLGPSYRTMHKQK